MMTKQKIEALRMAYKSSPLPYVGNLFDCLDTIEALWHEHDYVALLENRIKELEFENELLKKDSIIVSGK